MNLRDKTWLIKFDLASMRHFHQECYGCHAPIERKKGFVFHHLTYKSDEKTWSDFKNADGKYGDRERLQYMQYLAKIIRAEPKRFLLLCNACHQAVEKLKRYGNPRLRRLLKARRMSR